MQNNQLTKIITHHSYKINAHLLLLPTRLSEITASHVETILIRRFPLAMLATKTRHDTRAQTPSIVEENGRTSADVTHAHDSRRPGYIAASHPRDFPRAAAVASSQERHRQARYTTVHVLRATESPSRPLRRASAVSATVRGGSFDLGRFSVRRTRAPDSVPRPRRPRPPPAVPLWLVM